MIPISFILSISHQSMTNLRDSKEENGFLEKGTMKTRCWEIRIFDDNVNKSVYHTIHFSTFMSFYQVSKLLETTLLLFGTFWTQISINYWTNANEMAKANELTMRKTERVPFCVWFWHMIADDCIRLHAMTKKFIRIYSIHLLITEGHMKFT